VKVWITKYALSQGILEAEGTQTETPTMIRVRGKNTDLSVYDSYFHKPYWHLSPVDAAEHAKHLVDKKLASLIKQEKKLKKLRRQFDNVTEPVDKCPVCNSDDVRQLPMGGWECRKCDAGITTTP